MPLTYLRNRARTAGVHALERLLSEPLPKRRPIEYWSGPSQIGKAEQHPACPGLWVLRQALSPREVSEVRAFAELAMRPPSVESTDGVHATLAAAERECDLMLSKLRELPPGSDLYVEAAEATDAALQRRDELRAKARTTPLPAPPLRTRTRWDWFVYEPGRCMAPMLPHAGDSRALSSRALQRQHFSGFEVFDKAPVDEWLCLASLTESMQPGADAADARLGAATLRRLQTDLPNSWMHGAISADASCMFFQWQHLERGTAVAAHIDADVPPADTVATLSLGTGAHDTVRVGRVVFPLRAGDVYAICGEARWHVDHEVYCSTSDRLSLTIRFAKLADPPTLVTGSCAQLLEATTPTG
jgi:hypothetical protein|eukprot:jgi/Chrpa1/16639/Chrysochromulina_OHIO_Genome00021885-RA